MKTMIKTRNMIIVFLCITIISLGFGFALLSIKLNDITKNKPKFEVAIVGTENSNILKGGLVEPTIIHKIRKNSKTVISQITLFNPKDEINYIIKIKNKGTLPAIIKDVIESPEYTNELIQNELKIKITKEDIIEKKIMPKEEIEMKVGILYKDLPANIPIVPQIINYQLSIIADSI